MNILERAASPTPKFFKKVRTIGLILAAVSGTLLATPVALPIVVLKIAGYLTVAGAVATAVSQVTTTEEETEEYYGEEEETTDANEYPF